MNDIKFNAIAAICNENQGIGIENKLPWSIPEDAEYFLNVVKTTVNKSKINAILIGINTWKSLPIEERPIVPCMNVLISSKETKENLEYSKNADLNRIIICKSIDAALNEIKNKYFDIVESIYAIGGTRIYKESIESNYFNRFYLTRIFESYNCDRFIEPKNFLDKFKRIEANNLENEEKMFNVEYNKIRIDSQSGEKYIFEVYEKASI